MWNSAFHYCCNILSGASLFGLNMGPDVCNVIYRDELMIKKPPSSAKKAVIKKEGKSKEDDQEYYYYSKNKSSSSRHVRFKDTNVVEENSKKNINKNADGVIRVKVKKTKEEVARLPSKCKEGGVLEFKDVAHEIVQLPTSRVCVMSSDHVKTTHSTAVVLHTIPEENYY